MTKPDVTFKVRVSPAFRVDHCREYQIQEAKGLYGFHAYQTCPECRVTALGFEFWGENGHKQGGSLVDRRELASRLRILAGRQWRMKDGRLMGYRFVQGGSLYYQGSNL